MIFGPVTLALLFLPGLVIVALVVLVVLPRALRDEKRLKQRRCVHCGEPLADPAGTCPACGQSNTRPPRRDM
jgi:hypothetical protein